MNKTMPRFAIIDDIDAPIRRNVAEWKDGIGYCYMARKEEPLLKCYDGMNPDRPTCISEFGFDVSLTGKEALFVRSRVATATYPDGEKRRWQDVANEDGFVLPLVGKIRNKRPREREKGAK